MELYFKNSEEWRRWLEENGSSADGLEAYNEIFKKPHLAYDNKASGDPEIPKELLSALEANKTAFDNFMNFSPSSRRMYIEWYKFAKQDKTRTERIKKIISFYEQNKRPGMM